MNIAHLCVLVAAALPYLFVGYAKSSATYLKTGNNDPRAYAQTIEGGKRRAYNAHLNGFEAFPAFAAGVILAEMSGVAQGTVDLLAVVFIVARVLHGLLYIADQATARSVVWSVGIGCVVALFGLSL